MRYQYCMIWQPTVGLLWRDDNLFLTGFSFHVAHFFQLSLSYIFLMCDTHICSIMPAHSINPEIPKPGARGVLVGNQDIEESISSLTLHKGSGRNDSFKRYLWSASAQNPSSSPLPSFPSHCSQLLSCPLGVPLTTLSSYFNEPYPCFLHVSSKNSGL